MKAREKARKPAQTRAPEEGVHVAPLMMLRNIINQDFERFLSRFGVSAVSSQTQPFGGFSPGVNVMEKDNVVHVEAELPGISAEDVKVSLENNVLTIEGERKQVDEGKEQQMYRRELAYGFFRRTVAVPGEIAADRAQAWFKNGILTIELPISAPKPAPVKQIPIQNG